MLFGQAMLAQCLLAELGWTGAIYDERPAHVTQRDPTGETPPQANQTQA
jgi:hypothetical protein